MVIVRTIALLALGSIACRDSSKEPAKVAAEPVAPPPSSLPSPPPAPPPAPSPFVVVARIPARVESRLHPLGGHVAIWQRSSDEPYAWSLTSIGPDARTAEITKSLRSRIRDDGMELLFVAGSGPADAWIVTSYVVKDSAMAFAMQTWRVASDSLKPTNQPGYRFVGEFRKGQWVGVPFAIHPGYLLDDPPRTFRNLTGTGTLPKLPPKLSLFKATFVAEQRACGLGARPDDASNMALWMTSPDGMRVLPLGPLDQDARTVAVGQECVVVLPDKSGTTFKRLRGDTLTAVAIAEQASVASATSDGAIWIVHDHAVARVTLTEDAARANDVPLPRMPACSGPLEVSDVVALADNDVWITAGCKTETYLLHTQAAPPSSVATLPVP